MANNVLEKLKNEVFGRQKVLAEIYEKCGGFSIADYVSSWQVKPAVLDKNFTGIVSSLLVKIYGQDLAKEVNFQLENNPLVSTIDHHGILNHPFFINSNLIFSQRKGLKYLICFSTSGVSLNNSSWPGCLFVTGKSGKLWRYSFFSDSQKTRSVISAPALAVDQKAKLFGQIEKEQDLNLEQKQKIFRLLDKIIGADVFKQHDFSSQAGLISYRLWQEIFPKAPKVIYLPLEELVSEVVVNIVCKDPNHLLHRLFFSKQGWNLIEKHFQGSLGAFSGAHKGSFLFWGIDTKGRRVHLHRDESGIRNPRRSSRQARTLRGRHELGIEWELKPEKISVALKSKQLYPTSLVCFLVLLYYQITALGGFNQVNWLTNIKEKFIGLLLEMGESEIAEQIKSVPTSNFAESNLAFLVRNGKLIKASGLDIFLEEKDLFYRYQDLAGHLTLKESIESELLEIYKVIVPAQERDQSLLGNNSRLNSSLFEKIRLALDG